MARAVQRFGGRHTELKLRVLSEYLAAYLRVMQKQNFFRLTYIDAFSGTGWSRAGYCEDERQTDMLDGLVATKGSALRVFDVTNSGRQFDHYVFNDRRKVALNALRQEIEGRFPDALTRPEVEFTHGDANNVVERECARLRSNDRAVMFLDPYGMQVNWASIEMIARSHQIDLWYLAPVGAAYGRLMQLSGNIPHNRRVRLDEALGGSGWHEALYRTLPADLLGHTPVVRDAGWQAIANYFMGKWQGLFGAGALTATLPLGHPGRLPFLLCFACSNLNPRAYTPALGIADSLIEKARSGWLL